jgi:hypothetical protein
MTTTQNKILVIVALLISYYQSEAQNNSLSQIFYPNITLKTEAIPSVGYDGLHEYGLTRSSILGFVPLSTDLNVGIGIGKKWDIQAKHTFLVANLAQINTTIDNKETPTGGFKTASVGVIQLKASLRDKFWLYGGGLGVTESNETFFSPQPYMWGGVARMRIFGLNSQILYGTVVVYNQRFRLIPIFGFNKKINSDWRISGILPFQVNGIRKINEWFNVSGNAVLGGFSGGFQDIAFNEKLPRKENYQHIKFTVSANAHILKVFNVSLEGGLVTFRQLRYFNASGDNIDSFTPSTAPYFGASVRYISSKSKMSTKLMQKIGLF